MKNILKILRTFSWYKDLVLFPIYYTSKENYNTVCILVTQNDDISIHQMVDSMLKKLTKCYGVQTKLYGKHADIIVDLEGEKGEFDYNDPIF